MNLFFTYIHVIIFFNLYVCSPKENNRRKVDLRKTSRSLFKYVDLSKNTCEDFHEFACGKFMTENNVRINPNKIMDGFSTFVKAIFEGRSKTNTKVTRKLIMMHKKCSTLRNQESFFECTMKVEKFGFYGFASYYVSDVESNPKINKDFDVVNRMVNFIKEEFKNLLNEKKDFLDEATKKNYLKKIDGMVLYREHHQNLKNTKLMEECYDYFKFSTSDSADKMMKNIDKYASFVSSNNKKTQELCRHYIVDGKSDEAPLFLLVNENAFYDSKKNRFTINPMIFKEPYFDREFPMSLNYGSLGFVIGHELMHALDYYNINLDHEGNASINMTSSFSMDNYKKRSNCFLKQYNYMAKDVNNLEVEELMKLKEDIADNGGLKIAFRAYKSYYKSIKRVSPKIPGFAKYTGDQMFFINYGRFFCKHFVVPDRRMKGKITKHNPTYLRLRNTLGNFNEFSNEYKCNVGSKMNPKKKCELW